MAAKRVWAGSALSLIIFFFRAYASGNDTLSMDVQPSSAPSVTTKLTSAEKDGVKTTELGTTASPFDVQHTNEKTTGVTINVTVNSVTSDTYKNNTTARVETKLDDKWDEPFKYDYSSLRQAGLTIATVLFLLGIMVITCGKMRCGRRCRMGKGRSYDVTGM
ncbi:FXYD domain containing ion transport regulator 5 [Ictalurus furcatus]|uniref:FXYD domain containing ion transport regulator 5 n=1 Tax=Ictalurus furcatus TaxID=66913 RepID=UPI00234FDD42|nr:FXYD domain containing ion transport regulator 5 [Ictalurus furcatus]